MCAQVLSLALPLETVSLLNHTLHALAEAPRPLTVEALDAVLRRLDRRPLATPSGAFDAALLHLDDFREAFTRVSQTSRAANMGPSAQLRQLELLDDALRRVHVASEEGGPRRDPDAGPAARPAPDAPTPEAPPARPAPATPCAAAPLWGWGGVLLLAAAVFSVGCSLLAGAPGKTR
jgi:hypothetical protein